ncbi:MAG: hypothetical protein Q8M01_13775 [Rubrivivax sp.]|nr:hypothetical protein [Rubrivivax sp.]
MKTQNLNPSPAAVDSVVLGSRSFNGNVFASHMAVSGVTPKHFHRWLRLWALHTQALFDRATARRLQAVASGIARQLCRGYFGNTAGFEGIESEACHG